uniref:Retrovirus-related Pol polyprotein from transposon TNT 1-94 n=1 Tax=Tanacetum cinerariifolium TaxID=118510 RepID=A0A6L2JSL4_TANCI|nr:retrovirus-related Pol polyprotein from transposon TNT 1-94 [Tanacetum cinerariifolium]
MRYHAHTASLMEGEARASHMAWVQPMLPAIPHISDYSRDTAGGDQGVAGSRPQATGTEALTTLKSCQTQLITVLGCIQILEAARVPAQREKMASKRTTKSNPNTTTTTTTTSVTDAQLEALIEKSVAKALEPLSAHELRVELLSGSRDTNSYTISLDDMLKNSPICLISKASKTKSWLWHHRLSHLNFSTLNKLAKYGLARGIPRLKFQKDHMCSSCALGKSKKTSHQPNVEDTNQEKLYLLHMDLCGLICVESINGKKYILVIVDDYSRFTWVIFFRSKDEAPDGIIKYIKNIQVPLNATVRNVRTYNGTEFLNQTLCNFYGNVKISHQTFVPRTAQQNGVVEWRNRILWKLLAQC